ncbi:MAG: helix-turn-helix domain-containing protein [Saprospiraceae bacterium]
MDEEPLIDEELTERILEKLNTIMEEDKVFRQPDLSLSGLAKKLDTNDKYLRYVLGKTYTSGFVSFVNQYRVEDAKRMLVEVDYDIYTVESIGQMSGFKSKSSFYTAFKEATGKTPFQYRQEWGKEVL